jgi:hypothetical protein
MDKPEIMLMPSRAFLTLIVLAAVIIIASAVLAQPPGDPDAAAPGEVITGIVEFEGTRVYVGPDFAYDLLGQLTINSSVVILGRRGDFIYTWDGGQWLEIDFGGESGWVYGRLIRTSIPFNSIPPTGRRLPRNRDGRVPVVFNLSDNVCDGWAGDFTRSGDFGAGDTRLTVTYPELPGANVYSVITISPSGQRRAHDSLTITADIELRDLPREVGTYVWRVAPYWANGVGRSNWQQLCLLQTGGTFVVPGEPEPTRPPRFRFYYYGTPVPTPVPPPLVP